MDTKNTHEWQQRADDEEREDNARALAGVPDADGDHGWDLLTDAYQRRADEIASRERPPVELIGFNGNAFNILGRCKAAATRAGWTEDQWIEFRIDAASGDYAHLLAVVQDYFEVR